MGKDFFSLPEAAAVLGISRIAVFKKVRKGQLQAIRIGRNWAVAAATLTLYNTRGPQPDTASTKPVQAPPPPPPQNSDAEMNEIGWD